MKKSKFTEEQIAYALRQVEDGTPPVDVCRQLGVSEATFYIWKKKYAHLGVSELRQLRSLEDENGRLKRLVADLSLDKHILTEALRKKAEANTAPRAGRLGSDDLPCQLRAGLSSGAVQSSGVVPPKPCEGPDGVATPDSGDRARTPSVWLLAHLGAPPA
jgi:putative transposase